MFIKKANAGKNEAWMYILTIFLVFVGYFLGQIPLTIVLFQKMAQDSDGMEKMMEFQETMDFSLFGIDENVGFLLLLLTFVGATLALYPMVTRVHKKAFKDIVTARSKVDWGRIFWAFGLWFLFTIVLEVISYYLTPEHYVYQFNLNKFLPLVAISLFILPIQTSFEEFFFRGYLLQGISLISAFRWIPIVVTSIGFGAMHFMNPEVSKFGLGIMMTYYMSIGLLLAILTVMDDGMELALGIHAATNIYGATMVSFEGAALQTPTIFRVTELNVELMLVVSLVISALFLFIASRKYGWTDWSKIYRATGSGAVGPEVDV